MTKYYKLKKDLPTFKAGEEFYLNENGNLISVENEPLVVYSRQTLEKFPNILTDWFESANIGFYLDEGGYIVEYDEDEDPYYLNYRKSIGNDFKTIEEAKEYKKYLVALQIIKDDAKGFEPDWGSTSLRKVYGFYDHVCSDIDYAIDYDYKNQGSIYFNSAEGIKDSFKKHRKEWLIVLGVENEDND